MSKINYDPTDFVGTIKSIPDCVLCPDVRDTFSFIKNGRTLMFASGGFCVAFPMENASGEKKCFRVWKNLSITDVQKRYQIISDYLEHRSGSCRDYFSKFKFYPSAFRVADGQVLPGIVMDWVEGKKLSDFMRVQWTQLAPEQRMQFIREFYLMTKNLRDNHMAHGDLSCLNIIVTEDLKIRLLDYDSLYVPPMQGAFLQSTAGVQPFQHPERILRSGSLKVSLEDDNFSHLVIALSLWVAYHRPAEIVSMYADKNLIFTDSDLQGATPSQRLENLHRSRGWLMANSLSSSIVRELMTTLERGLAGALSDVPRLDSLPHFAPTVAPASQPALPKAARFCTHCGHRFQEKDNFCTQCGHPRFIYK